MGKMIPSEKSWIGTPPAACEYRNVFGGGCSNPLAKSFVDGKTREGPWGCLCTSCHKTRGVGLGTVKGQRYDNQANGMWAIMVPAPKAPKVPCRHERHDGRRPHDSRLGPASAVQRKRGSREIGSEVSKWGMGYTRTAGRFRGHRVRGAIRDSHSQE